MFHSFSSNIESQLPTKFTYPFCYQPHPLSLKASEEVMQYLSTQIQWQEELSLGKMFGVLVVKNQEGELGYLAAFSGQIASSYLHPFFVPPIYDLNDSNGFFLQEEKEISSLNDLIHQLLNDDNYCKCKKHWELLQHEYSQFIEEKQRLLAESKQIRDKKRSLSLSEEEKQSLIKESQYQKAQFKREKQLWQEKFSEVKIRLEEYDSEIARLQKERKTRSALLQQKLFNQFELLNAKGEIKNLTEIFYDYGELIPPGGAGECAAPKLLQYAYQNSLIPLCMAEFWWGNSPSGVLRKHGSFYPSCSSKCGPILSFMLQGLVVEENPLSIPVSHKQSVKVIWEDDYLLILNKPHGMLSVPGKEDVYSLYDYVRQNWNNLSGPLIVHRLDMATSGLIVIAKDKISHQHLQNQFENHTIEKTYVAILEGIVETDAGEISLPLLPDFNNRPYQMVDYKLGKPAYTTFKILERGEDYTRIEFYPHTGRTHQLRIHAAHPSGLNHPIKGDVLYGNVSDRLYLHAQSITFDHPRTGERLTFSSPSEF